jgi:restriction system protein
MGKRSQSKQSVNGSGCLLSFIAALVAPIFYAVSFKDTPGFVAFLTLATWGGLICLRVRLNRKALENVKDKLRDVVAHHMSALVRRRTQLLITDAYGTVDATKWSKEIGHFLETKLVPLLAAREQRQAEKNWQQLHVIVEEFAAAAFARNQEIYMLPVERMSGADFEVHCAQRLMKCGWVVQTTKASGDQGIDVIAEMHGRKIVLQCKFYSQPVGNKAVQEVAAGRIHYGAQFGGVVSNATFTPSARELAATNRVLLLHFSELDGLAQSLGLA